ncbi:Rpn family recombination-promoting nuclease/putative transposase [Faecalicatena orotica]|uniref:Putative transposase/invertase (TIGR01784 family) n=1 Tax=Faecalicatena orotica TaxID=1544 RepID=A0A2Y9BBV8_9FIRM|nr:Rpn family recombination-promoting nuclease/putative transposase [Faecalicatena orotica]PWJ32394.1 putative transposase/invertase (TIGR01784 family) [Faecalicatena orotica]SSA54228.1 conserved hypothetical protein (putative transposase or invertase) [Faecalicatena orotica]
MEEKQKIQITEDTDVLTPLQKLNLTDDFLFDIATSDLEACRIMIELALGISIHSIRWKEGQKVIHNIPGKRGIRMDFYVEDEIGRIFDVEMQKRNEGNLPKRTRFYQALVDAPLLERGEKGFDNLNPMYIVVICNFDLYGFKKYKYTFENRCEEEPGLIMGDECKKVFLNTKGKNDSETEKSLIDFLHFVERSSKESLPQECDERLKYLYESVEKIKSNEQIGVTYMKMEERDRLIREEGVMKGQEMKLIDMVCKKMKKGKSLQEIREELEEDMDTIRPIYEIAGEMAPDYDTSEIFDKLHHSDSIE